MADTDWNFDAPTFVDFGSNEHEKGENVDSYFDFNHEDNSQVAILITDEPNNNKLPSVQDKAHDQDITNTDDTTQGTSSRETFEPTENTNETCEMVQSADREIDEVEKTAVSCSENEGASSVPEDPDSLDEEVNADMRKTTEIKNGETDHTKYDAMRDDTAVCTMSPVTDLVEMKTELAAELNEAEKSEKDSELMEVSTCKREEMKNVVSSNSRNHVPSNLITPSRVVSWNNARRKQNSNPPPKFSASRRSNQLKKVKELRRSGRFFTPPVTPVPNEGPPSKKRKSAKQASVTLVEPHTPRVLKHARHMSSNKVIKSSEELELEEIEDLKHKAKQITKESSKSMKRALTGPAHNPEQTIKSIKTTKPKEFKFKTDERIKQQPQQHTMTTRSRTTSAEINFAMGLRQHPPSPGKLKPTVIKPFNLSSSRKRKMEKKPNSSKGYEFVPMAKAVVNFENKSIRSTSSQVFTHKGPIKAEPALTVAKTPRLESRSRTRPVTVVSAKEKEDREVEEMKKHQFRAHPLNREILEHPDPLPNVRRSTTTEAVGFNLETDKRFEHENPTEDSKVSPIKKFKARPVPKKILKGVVGVPKVEPLAVTTAQSPAFTLKNRMQVAQKNKENLEMKRAKAQEESEKRAKKSLQTHQNTPLSANNTVAPQPVKIQPFSFDVRDKERFAKKEQKIQQIIEEEKAAASAFRATPIIESCPEKSLPPKQKPQKTDIKPFKFLSEERCATRNTKLTEEEWEEKDRAQREFRATNTNYTKVLYGKGFQPVKSGKKTEIEEFSLHTEQRASERVVFEEKKKKREEVVLRQMMEDKKVMERREREAIAQARREAEHKAAPIRKYAPVIIKPSERNLTAPKSPNFSDRFNI